MNPTKSLVLYPIQIRAMMALANINKHRERKNGGAVWRQDEKEKPARGSVYRAQHYVYVPNRTGAADSCPDRKAQHVASMAQKENR